MSVKGRRSLLVWVLLGLVLFAIVANPVGFRGMVVLPGYGYRAYEWTWHVRYEGMKEDTGWAYWADNLRDTIKQQLGKCNDENRNPIVIYQGPTISYYDFKRTSGNLWDYVTFTAETHTWFYGFFPNNLPEAIPLEDRLSDTLERIFNVICPKGSAFVITWTIAAIIIAIIAGVTIFVGAQALITVLNLLNERQRWEQAENWPEPLQFIYAIIQSFFGWLQTLGPVWILLICAVVVILVFAGGGKKRR